MIEPDNAAVLQGRERELFERVRRLAGRYSLKRAIAVFPAEYRELLSEILVDAYRRNDLPPAFAP
jgi:hypothetical protein